MRLFKLVERLLVEDEKYRNDDLPLHLKIWELLGIIKFEYEFVGNSAVRKKYPILITDSPVLGKVIGHDTIRRSRQKFQERHPEKYGPTDPVVIARRKKTCRRKGTHIFSEQAKLVHETLFLANTDDQLLGLGRRHEPGSNRKVIHAQNPLF